MAWLPCLWRSGYNHTAWLSQPFHPAALVPPLCGKALSNNGQTKPSHPQAATKIPPDHNQNTLNKRLYKTIITQNVQAIGAELDLTDKGLGLRSRRYAMLVDDGTVRA